MPLINIPVGIAPCQIDDFPENVGKGKDAVPFERSCQGALYLRPASTKVVTVHELDHIRQHKDHKMLTRRMVVVKVDVIPDAGPRSKAKVTDEQKARAKVKAEMREKGKALPMTGPRAKLAVRSAELAAKAAAKGKEQPAETKPDAPEPAAETESKAESADGSSGESGGSRSSRRRRGGG